MDNFKLIVVSALFLVFTTLAAYLLTTAVSEGIKEQVHIIKEPQIIEVPKIVYEPPEPSILSAEPLGEFTVTYYTAGKESTGKTPKHPAYGVTFSGAKVTEGVTVAVDPEVIPLGSYLYIEGIGFRVAQDTGSVIKSKSIDIYVPKLKDVPEVGKHTAKVYIIKEAVR